MTRAPVVAVAVVLAAGCASVPRAAPELAAMLGERIQETRAAHQRAVRLFMAEKRAAVDRFVDTEWVPRFATNLFAEPAVAAEWQRVVRSNSDAERLEFIRRLGPMLQTRINAKRQELIAPLDEAERAILAGLDDHYAEMIAINASLVGLLEATAETSERQARVMARLDPGGVLPSMLDRAGEITDLIIEELDGYERHRARIDSLLGVLRQAP